MKKILWFMMPGCPYCRQAETALKRLQAENPAWQAAEIERIDETERPDIAQRYDYYYVPALFVDGKKRYEAQPGETQEACTAHMREVLAAACGG